MLYVTAVVSFLTLIFTIVLGAKNYRKSKRIEFLQRRDRLAQALSDLNDRNAEFHNIVARYAIVIAKKTGLPLRGEQAERNLALIPDIQLQQEGVKEGIASWDKNIAQFQLIYKTLTLVKDADAVEKVIADVQISSDTLKRAITGYSSILDILETTNEMVKTTLVEQEEKLRQINLDFERGMREFKLTHPEPPEPPELG
jgi:hypothetical protein